MIMDLPFSDGEYQRRLNACHQLMNEKELDAFISFTPENIYYLTGHDTPVTTTYRPVLSPMSMILWYLPARLNHLTPWAVVGSVRLAHMVIQIIQ